MEEYNSPSNLKGLASDVNDNKITVTAKFAYKAVWFNFLIGAW
jgi:hypothetical protein